MAKCNEAYDISTRNWQHSCIIAEKYSTMFYFFIPCPFHICIHGAQLSCTWDFYHDIFKKGECDLLYICLVVVLILNFMWWGSCYVFEHHFYILFIRFGQLLDLDEYTTQIKELLLWQVNVKGVYKIQVYPVWVLRAVFQFHNFCWQLWFVHFKISLDFRWRKCTVAHQSFQIFHNVLNFMSSIC